MARADRPLRLATRGSPLARWQADRIGTLLRSTGVDSTVVVVETEGDRRAGVPIDELGGRGVFVREVQAAVSDGRADVAVHSAKDLPASDDLAAPGLVMAAVPERADPRDLLVGSALSELPPGSVVATGSSRRRAQLANLRADLSFRELRGNIGTRLAHVGRGVSAVVVAKAAVDRLGWTPPTGMATEVLEPVVMVPQVAQGALAVECRADDAGVVAALARIDDAGARTLVDAERAFLAELGGGCTLPVGAHARWLGGATDDATGRRFGLVGMVASHDGRTVLRHEDEGVDPVEVGCRVARFLLDQAGGRQLLGWVA